MLCVYCFILILPIWWIKMNMHTRSCSWLAQRCRAGIGDPDSGTDTARPARRADWTSTACRRRPPTSTGCCVRSRLRRGWSRGRCRADTGSRRSSAGRCRTTTPRRRTRWNRCADRTWCTRSRASAAPDSCELYIVAACHRQPSPSSSLSWSIGGSKGSGARPLTDLCPPLGPHFSREPVMQIVVVLPSPESFRLPDLRTPARTYGPLPYFAGSRESPLSRSSVCVLGNTTALVLMASFAERTTYIGRYTRMSSRRGFCCGKSWRRWRRCQTGTVRSVKFQSNHHHHQHTVFLQDGCHSCHPTYSVKVFTTVNYGPLLP